MRSFNLALVASFVVPTIIQAAPHPLPESVSGNPSGLPGDLGPVEDFSGKALGDFVMDSLEHDTPGKFWVGQCASDQAQRADDQSSYDRRLRRCFKTYRMYLARFPGGRVPWPPELAERAFTKNDAPSPSSPQPEDRGGVDEGFFGANLAKPSSLLPPFLSRPRSGLRRVRPLHRRAVKGTQSDRLRDAGAVL